MARGKALDETTKAEILRLAEEGKKAKEIEESLGISRDAIYMFLLRTRRNRDCESCGRTIKDVEAVFCPYCGKKILTEKDRVMEHLNDIGKCVGEFPNSFRDRIMANVNEIRKYIKGH